MLSIEKVKDLNDIMKLVPKDAKEFYRFLSSVNTLDFDDEFGLNIDFELEQNKEDEDKNVQYIF